MTVDGTTKAFMKIWNGSHYYVYVCIIRRWWTVAAALNRFNEIWAKKTTRKRERNDYTKVSSNLPPPPTLQKTPIFTSFNFFIVCLPAYVFLRRLLISFRCNVNKITNVYSNFILFVYLFVCLLSCYYFNLNHRQVLQFTIHNSLSNVLQCVCVCACVFVYLCISHNGWLGH